MRIRSKWWVADTCLSSSASTSSASDLARGDEDGGRQRVVLGLADQVGGDVRRVGGVVGEDRDLGRAGLGVDADPSLEEPLGGDHVDVAGTGHQVDPGTSWPVVAPVPPVASRRQTPYANIAIACAPPTAYTSSTPSSAHAARIVGCTEPP